MARRQPTGGGNLDGSGAMAARRRLGRTLTELREAKGITQEEAAEYIERVPSTLYKIEHGLPGVKIKVKHDVLALCELYGVDDEETRQSLVALTEATWVKGPFQPYTSVIAPSFDMYLGLENDASAMTTYETDVVPGLLQTADYARAIMGLPGGDGRKRDAAEVDKRVELRLQRQAVLTRQKNPLSLDVVLAESVLRRPVGGAQTMSAQLAQLNKLSELSNVSLRVVPDVAELHLGVTTGQFISLRFSDGSPPIIYVDTYLGGVYFREPHEVDRYDDAFRNIGDTALSERATRDFIKKAAREMTRDA